jgi:hypothetical protein
MSEGWGTSADAQRVSARARCWQRRCSALLHAPQVAASLVNWLPLVCKTKLLVVTSAGVSLA